MPKNAEADFRYNFGHAWYRAEYVHVVLVLVPRRIIPFKNESFFYLVYIFAYGAVQYIYYSLFRFPPLDPTADPTTATTFFPLNSTFNKMILTRKLR